MQVPAPDALAQEFVRFSLQAGVLRFGEFKTKAGRLSPYFFNAGLFDDGAKLGRLAEFYARRLLASGLEFDMLFGPAYKGITLAAAVAIELARAGRNVPYAYNRKEAKDHGEGGRVVGRALAGRVVIVDDVITAGTAIRESVDLIRAAGAEPVAVLLALDRQERGRGERSAVQEVEAEFGLRCISLLTLDALIDILANPVDGAVAPAAEHLAALRDYRAQYGVTASL